MLGNEETGDEVEGGEEGVTQYVVAIEAINNATRFNKDNADYFRNSEAVLRQIAVLRKELRDRAAESAAKRAVELDSK